MHLGRNQSKKNTGYRFFCLGIFLCLFFGCLFGCTTTYAQDVLLISGPTEVFEDDSVSFVVTLNGEPVQARVLFGDGSAAKYSNSTNGVVNFTAPTIQTTYSWFTVTASILGTIYCNHSILVKNITGSLDISFSTESPNELEPFYITVTNHGNPVSDAYVWFNASVSKTNSMGQVLLFAPDVLMTTSLGLQVNKTGFSTQTQMITINNINQGLKFMQVIFPAIVEPGTSDIPIQVLGLNGGIEHAVVNVSYEGIVVGSFSTDAFGNALITAPLIVSDDFFTLEVQKTGYETFSGVHSYYISLFESTLADDLRITISPSEVYEGDTFTLTITDEAGMGIPDVSIWRDTMFLGSRTDVQGMLVLVAPSVFIDQQIYIYGVLPGYNYAQGIITVRNRVVNDVTLSLRTELAVNESSLFTVTVVDSNNEPVSQVLVTFNNEQELSDANGVVYFTAPQVSETLFYTILAEKPGYMPAFLSLEIINTTTPSDTDPLLLSIFVVPVVLEHEQFTIFIKDSHGFPIASARVRFQDTDFFTDASGQVVVSAPDVGSDMLKTIVVTKAGYISASDEILIKNQSDFPYWYLLIIIVLILVVGVVVYFRFNRII